MTKCDMHKDPEELGAKLSSEKPTGFKTVLGLDLGTSCGYSYSFIDGASKGKPRVYAGQLDLSAGPYDSGGIRFARLRQFLYAMRPDLVSFEDVKYTPPSMGFQSVGAVIARAATACEWFGALKATLCTWCEENNVPCTGMPIGSIKKRATGRGNANKTEMIAACNLEFSFDFDVEGYESTGVDNIADAVFVRALILEQYGNGILFEGKGSCD